MTNLRGSWSSRVVREPVHSRLRTPRSWWAGWVGHLTVATPGSPALRPSSCPDRLSRSPLPASTAGLSAPSRRSDRDTPHSCAPGRTGRTAGLGLPLGQRAPGPGWDRVSFASPRCVTERAGKPAQAVPTLVPRGRDWPMTRSGPSGVRAGRLCRCQVTVCASCVCARLSPGGAGLHGVDSSIGATRKSRARGAHRRSGLRWHFAA